MSEMNSTLADFGGETDGGSDGDSTTATTPTDTEETSDTERSDARNGGSGAVSSETDAPNVDELQAYTYEATLYAPLFYASKEGTVIETDPTVSATALMHAIGYEYYSLGRAFALAGDAANNPDYTHLFDLPFYTSEMTPANPDVVDERTFRTVSYTTERAVVSQDRNACQYLTGKSSPVPRNFEGSRTGWHKMREFIGISPETEFTFTIWATPSTAPPERIGFRAGIKRTGEVRAVRADEPVDTVTLNQYLLQSVYDLDETLIYGIMDHAADFKRGTDVRTSRFLDVDTEWVTNNVMPEVLTSRSG